MRKILLLSTIFLLILAACSESAENADPVHKKQTGKAAPVDRVKEKPVKLDSQEKPIAPEKSHKPESQAAENTDVSEFDYYNMTLKELSEVNPDFEEIIKPEDKKKFAKNMLQLGILKTNDTANIKKILDMKLIEIINYGEDK